MQIEVRGRNVQVAEELREAMSGRSALRETARQVSEFAVLEVELLEGSNAAIADYGQVAEATLHLKGTTLRAQRGLAGHAATRSIGSPRTCAGRSSAAARSAAAAPRPAG